jgi:hypothetical protein
VRRLVIVVLGLLSSAGACRFGTTVEKFGPASSARGVTARVTTGDVVVSGELLEVQQTGLLLVTAKTAGSAPAAPPDCRVRFVPFAQIGTARVDGLGGDYQITGPRPRPENVERLRLVSRFPHGLAADLLKQLLASCGQTEVAGGQS